MKRYISSAMFTKTAKVLISDKMQVVPDHIHVVWHCKTLQHHKGLFMIITSNNYFEVTYNGDTGEMYLDTYEKNSNEVFNVPEQE